LTAIISLYKYNRSVYIILSFMSLASLGLGPKKEWSWRAGLQYRRGVKSRVILLSGPPIRCRRNGSIDSLLAYSLENSPAKS